MNILVSLTLVFYVTLRFKHDLSYDLGQEKQTRYGFYNVTQGPGNNRYRFHRRHHRV